MHATAGHVRAALKAGADGYLLKTADEDEFLVAIRALLKEKGSNISTELTGSMIISYVDGNAEAASKADSLTPKEKMVLKLIAEGNSNEDIAAKLNLSVKTIDTHRTSFMKKLDLHNVREVTRFAMQNGLVGDGIDQATPPRRPAPFGGLSVPARNGTPRPHGPCNHPTALLLRGPAASRPVRGSGLRLSGRDNSLIVALERFPPGFNPAVASGSLTSQIGRSCSPGWSVPERTAPYPHLAESWEIDSQAKRFRFHLRKGATFHDGTPITANDVAFSIRAAQRHHPFRSMLEAVRQGVVPVDDLTLDLAGRPSRAARPAQGLHPRRWSLSCPPTSMGDGTPIDTHPANLRAVGSGPFRLASLEKGKTSSSNVTKAFSSPGKPRLDRITFRVYWDQNEIPACVSCRARPIPLRLLFPVG